ncbi:MAG: hypothetical protein L3J91_02680 [Thermoplasmata archaeon]|nr:hypothetical protein [Thermoplasmata archaeon]
MIHSTVHAERDYLVVGVVRGRPVDVAPAVQLLDGFRPQAVGLGLSVEELTGLAEHFAGTLTEPIVPLAPTEAAEVKGLVRFGEVRVPNPAFVRMIEWGREHTVPVEALDIGDEGYVTMFTDHISYFELVRRTLRERKLSKRPPAAETADDYMVQFDRARSPGHGSARFAEARETALVSAARGLVPNSRRVAVLVDRERFERVAGMLSASAPVAATRVPG